MIELGSGDYSSQLNGQGHILSIQIKLTLSPRPTNNLRKRSLGYPGRKRWKVSSCYGLLRNKRAGPYYYRPQRSWGKVYVFTGVCHSVNGGSTWPGTPRDQVHPPLDQVHPSGTRYTPLDQVHPPGAGTPPRTRYTPQTRYTPTGPGTPPPDQVPPWSRYTPQDQVHPPWTRYTPLGPGTPPRLIQIF